MTKVNMCERGSCDELRKTTNEEGTYKRSVGIALRSLGWLACGLAIAAMPGVASATPVISEVLYDAVGGDDTYSFVEIYGEAGSVLDGLTLEGVNGANGAIGPIIALSGVIPSDGVWVVADRDSSGVTLVANADQLANFDFQNGPDSIVLKNGATVLDALGYGVFGAGETFAGEGVAAMDAPAGSSLARLFANVDQDDNSLDFVVLGSPTPGVVPLLSVPEPGTAVLTSMGLLGMAGLARRASRRSVA
ncbi:MAG: hypothetical protein ACI8W3_001637 [Myxococcota bacterium]